MKWTAEGRREALPRGTSQMYLLKGWEATVLQMGLGLGNVVDSCWVHHLQVFQNHMVLAVNMTVTSMKGSS